MKVASTSTVPPREGLWHLEPGVLTAFPTFAPQDEPPPDTQHLFHPEGLCEAALSQHLEDHSCSLTAGMRRGQEADDGLGESS